MTQAPFSPTGAPFPPSPKPTPASIEPAGDDGPTVINVGAPDPEESIPLPDTEIEEIRIGLMIPNAESIKRMAYEIKKARGSANPAEV